MGLDGDGEDGEASSAPPLIHIFFCGHLWHGECLGDAGGGVGASSSSSSSLPSPSHGSFYSSSSSYHPPLHPNVGKGSSLAAITPSRFSPQGQSRSRAASRADVTPQYGGGWGNDTPEWGAPSSGSGVGTRSRTSSVLADARARPRGMSDAAAPSPPSFSPRGGGGRGGKAPTLRCPLCK